MNPWIQLSPEEANKLFHVPLTEAFKESNSFYSIPPLPYTDNSYDGPWPLLSFLQISNLANILTFQVNHVEVVALAYEDFNPLEDDAGYLYLDKNALIHMTDLLLFKASKLLATNSPEEPMFTEISGEDIEILGLKDVYFPSERQRFFRQNRSVVKHLNEYITVFVCVVDTANPSPYLAINIYQIPSNNNLSQGDQYKTFGRLDLDRQGLEELASILMAQMAPYNY